MNEEKQIEEMAKDIACKIAWDEDEIPTVNCLETAKRLYTAGYRKVSEVAEEIFAEVEASAKVNYWRGGGLIVFEVDGEDFAELKKKYTEEKDYGNV